ncbi:MAG: hypothetical protein PUE01_00265 [Clostridiaceae bacterium]|nr:hypothetical protein [Clostridiaceae bacterium]
MKILYLNKVLYYWVELKNKGINEIVLFTSREDETEGFYHKRGLKSYNSMVMMGKEL